MYEGGTWDLVDQTQLTYPIQSLSQREELLVTSLLVLFSQLSERMEVIFLSGI